MLKKALQNKNELVIIKGPSGCGKTYMIHSLAKELGVCVEVYTPELLHCKQNIDKLYFALHSKGLFNKNRVIVIENADELQKDVFNQLVLWSEKRKNNKLKLNFHPISHNSLILTTSINVKNISCPVIQLEMPHLQLKLHFLKMNAPWLAHNNYVANLCQSYYDLLQYIQQNPDKKNLICDSQLSKMTNIFKIQYAKQREIYEKKLKSQVSSRDFTELCKLNEYQALNAIRTCENRRFSTNGETILDKFIQFTSFDYFSYLYFSFLPFNTRTHITESLEWFSDNDILNNYNNDYNHYNIEINETFIHCAILVSPIYKAEETFPKKYNPRKRDVNNTQFLDDIKYSLQASNYLDCIERLSLMQSKKENVFPKNHLGWDDEHLQKHNQRAQKLFLFQEENHTQIIEPLVQGISSKRTCIR